MIGIYFSQYLKIFLLLNSLFLFSCSTPQTFQQLSQDYDIEKQPGKAVIIGKVEIKEPFLGIPSFNSLEVIEAATGKKYFLDFSRDENFFAVLDSGRYNIERIWVGHGVMQGAMRMATYVKQVGRTFSVEMGEIVYLGKISAEVQKSGMSIIVRNIDVIDEYDMAVNEFRKQYPNIKKDIKKNLLK